MTDQSALVMTKLPVTKEASHDSLLQERAATVTAVVLAILGIVFTPFAGQPLPMIKGYIPGFCASMFVVNTVLSVLLIGRSVILGSVSSLRLGATYLFVATIFIPFMLTFPDALVSGSVIGGPGSVVWVWVFWHAGFGLGIVYYARAASATSDTHSRLNPALALLLTLLISVALTSIACYWADSLPSLISSDEKALFRGEAQIVPITILAIDVGALICILRLSNRSAEQHWLCAGMVAACFDVWLTFRGIDRFSLGWYVSKVGSLTTSLVILVSLIFDQISLYRQVLAANGVLAGLANQDGLTRLANRRCFDQTLVNEWLRAQRNHTSIALLMIDVDLFKQYNDRHGHLAGDEGLRRVARALEASVFRPADLAARYGGEEFAVILPETDVHGATELASRILSAVRETGIRHESSPYAQLTVSIGIATLIPSSDMSINSFIEMADQALYSAKSSGRNQVQSS